MNDVITTPLIPKTMTRGGWYLIEALLQKPAAFTPTKPVTRRVSRLWTKLKNLNKPISTLSNGSEVNHEYPFARPEGLTDEQWQRLVVEMGDKFRIWQDQTATIELKTKEIQLIETGIEWALKNRDKIWPENNAHIASLLDAFQDTDDE